SFFLRTALLVVRFDCYALSLHDALPILVAKLRVPWAGSGCRRDEWRPIAPSAVMLGPNAMYRLQAVTAHPCDPEPICRSSTAPYRTMTSLSANVRGESPDGSVTGRIVIVLGRTASSDAR